MTYLWWCSAMYVGSMYYIAFAFAAIDTRKLTRPKNNTCSLPDTPTKGKIRPPDYEKPLETLLMKVRFSNEEISSSREICLD